MNGIFSCGRLARCARPIGRVQNLRRMNEPVFEPYSDIPMNRYGFDEVLRSRFGTHRV